MSFKLSALLLFTFLAALTLAAWTTWNDMLGYYAGKPPFRLSLTGAAHFLLLFAAPAALVGCLFGMAGRGFMIGSAMAFAWLVSMM